MKRLHVLILVIFISTLFLFGCDKIKNMFGSSPKPVKVEPVAIKGTVIAKIGSQVVTLEELNKEVENYNTSIDLSRMSDEEKRNAKIDSREKKVEYFNNALVEQKVFYQAALDRRIDTRDDIVELLSKDKMMLLAQEMQREVIKDVDVTDPEIEEAYNGLKEQLKEPETRKVREIVTRTEDEAKRILSQLLTDGDFTAIAKNNSIGSTQANEGLVKTPKNEEYVSRGVRGPAFAAFDEVVFSPQLQKGSLSHIFKGPEGFYIIKIEGIKEGQQVPLNKVRDNLKEILLAKKRKDALDKFSADVRKKIQFEIKESEIK